MPNRVTNNAVAHGVVDDITYVYSFSVLGSTKTCGSTHLLGFYYNTETQEYGI